MPIDRIRTSASQPPEAGTTASSSNSAKYAAGDTVLGNFKGLGDWDEALIVPGGLSAVFDTYQADSRSRRRPVD